LLEITGQQALCPFGDKSGDKVVEVEIGLHAK
jgi:hypothetical protein